MIRRWLRVIGVTVAILAGSAAIIWATCVSRIYSTQQVVGTIYLSIPSGGSADVASAVNDQSKKWNSFACNTKTVDPESGIVIRKSPILKVGTGGFIIKERVWDNLPQSCHTVANNANAPWLCGCTVRDQYNPATVGVVFLNKDEVRGSHCGLGTTVVHEFGHVFGLKDSGCPGYAMTDPGPADSPHSTECAVVGASWKTTSEQAQDDWDAAHLQTPLVLDMGGDGVLTSSFHTEAVWFDIDGDGEKEETGWLYGFLDDVFLWLDLNNNHSVDGANELFGTATVTPWGQALNANNGFEALAAYDSPEYGGNGDGQIDNADRIWAHLSIWHDLNSDGISAAGEISPIAGVQIVRFDLAHRETNRLDGSMNYILGEGRFWMRGVGGGLHERTVVDVAFRHSE